MGVEWTCSVIIIRLSHTQPAFFFFKAAVALTLHNSLRKDVCAVCRQSPGSGKKIILHLKKKEKEEESANLLKRSRTSVCWLLFAVFQFKHLQDEMKMKTFFFLPLVLFFFF